LIFFDRFQQQIYYNLCTSICTGVVLLCQAVIMPNDGILYKYMLD